MAGEFDGFTPDCFMDDVEEALGRRLGSYAAALPSYVNRVYEIESESRERLVAKFYRPGRWSREAILDEHAFVLDCAMDDLPVAAPLELECGGTLGGADGMPFAVYPKRRGRETEFESLDSLRKVGSLIAMIHSAGVRGAAPHRVLMTPDDFAERSLDRLFDCGVVHHSCEREFHEVCAELIDLSAELFERVNPELMRIHGDFHRGNVLDRPGEGLLAIDFDDMATGPQVQDIWLLLPGRPRECPRETDALLDGYTRFVDFDRGSLRLVEALRGMRMLHFLSWCALQSGDARFRDNFPDWGTEQFWRSELYDMEMQLEAVRLDLE